MWLLCLSWKITSKGDYNQQNTTLELKVIFAVNYEDKSSRDLWMMIGVDCKKVPFQNSN